MTFAQSASKLLKLFDCPAAKSTRPRLPDGTFSSPSKKISEKRTVVERKK